MYETTDAQTNNWNRETVLERSVGIWLEDLNQFYSRETSPLIMM